ncbi:MAG TPA: LPS assembly lipoprotein LptE [Steroidobacteraceae bacterium]|nr:LPS assembly lipoprotein LptE [Steroidobacteraceae bacterium]
MSSSESLRTGRLAPGSWRPALALVALAVLGGCGFHLAGSAPLPAVLARPHLSFADPYSDFARFFSQQLQADGAVAQPSAAGATATVDVSRDSVEQRVLSVSARNIPTEYLLIYTVTYSVHDAKRQLLAPQTISLTQDYSFSEQAVLAKEHEADMLRRQMARDLVAIAMRRIASLK